MRLAKYGLAAVMGFVLMLAGVAKLSEPSYFASYLADLFQMSDARLVFASHFVATTELAFGAWLISGWAPILSRVIGAGAFTTFLVANAMAPLGLNPTPCGCFGSSSELMLELEDKRTALAALGVTCLTFSASLSKNGLPSNASD